jgi:hypothetical protein
MELLVKIDLRLSLRTLHTRVSELNAKDSGLAVAYDVGAENVAAAPFDIVTEPYDAFVPVR